MSTFGFGPSKVSTFGLHSSCILALERLRAYSGQGGVGGRRRRPYSLGAVGDLGVPPLAPQAPLLQRRKRPSFGAAGAPRLTPQAPAGGRRRRPET